MSETKSKIEELKQKVYKKQQEQRVEEAKAQIDEELTEVGYDIFEYKPGRFKMAVIRYNPETMKAYVTKVVHVKDTYRQVALRNKNDKASLKQLLLKGKVD